MTSVTFIHGAIQTSAITVWKIQTLVNVMLKPLLNLEIGSFPRWSNRTVEYSTDFLNKVQIIMCSKAAMLSRKQITQLLVLSYAEYYLSHSIIMAINKYGYSPTIADVIKNICIGSSFARGDAVSILQKVRCSAIKAGGGSVALTTSP